MSNISKMIIRSKGSKNRAARLAHIALHFIHTLSLLSQAFVVRPSLFLLSPNVLTIPMHEHQISRRSQNDEKESEASEQSKSVHFLILPGFFNDSQDYTMPGSLLPCLSSRSTKHPRQLSRDRIHVLPIQRKDWLTVFLCGILDVNFWKSDMSPQSPSFAWYLERIYKEVNRIVTEQVGIGINEENVKVVLLGHSAGGWLARAALGFGTVPKGKEFSFARTHENKIALKHIAGLVSLGTPHKPPPATVMDMTRGALRITDELFPGAFHSPDGLFYVTIVGNAVEGKEQTKSTPFQPRTLSEVAFISYEAVCGKGTTVGDGVVPINSAHLHDAIQLVLPNVFHSINAPEDWYGSEKIIDQWLGAVIEQLENQNGTR